MNDPAYIVCAAPRVGSTHLCAALSEVPGAGAPIEYFGRPAIHRFAGEWGLRGDTSTVDDPVVADPARYLDRVRGEANRNGRVSMKVHWNQIEWCRDHLGIDPFGVTDGFDTRYIRIFRHDLIAQTVSTFIASITKVYYQLSGEAPRPSEEFGDVDHDEPEYDFDLMLRVFGEIAAIEYGWTPFFEKHGIVPLEVGYEALDEDLTGTVNEVLEHLGMPPCDVVTSPLAVQRTDLNRQYADRFLYDLRRTAILDELPSGLRDRCTAGAKR